MAISETEQYVILNAIGFLGLHEQKIRTFLNEYKNNPSQQLEDDIKTQIRLMRRLLNTLFTRNTITAEVRGYTDQELVNMRIKQE